MSKIVKVNEMELAQARNRYRILVAQVLFKNFQEFKVFEAHVPRKTSGQYEDESGNNACLDER